MPYPLSLSIKCFTRYQSFPYCTNNEKVSFYSSTVFRFIIFFRNVTYYNIYFIVCLFCFLWNLHQKSQEHMWFDNLNTDLSNKIIIINHIPGKLFYDNILFNLYIRKWEFREALFIMKKSARCSWIILTVCILQSNSVLKCL